mmetsp:Transcript_6783/g.16381  ORF Transcript_6783/g.16381 Transcript_6783/m.16381 type:complete len:202 (-) Transcript_6783:228-833(-)
MSPSKPPPGQGQTPAFSTRFLLRSGLTTEYILAKIPGGLKNTGFSIICGHRNSPRFELMPIPRAKRRSNEDAPNPVMSLTDIIFVRRCRARVALRHSKYCLSLLYVIMFATSSGVATFIRPFKSDGGPDRTINRKLSPSLVFCSVLKGTEHMKLASDSNFGAFSNGSPREAGPSQLSFSTLKEIAFLIGSMASSGLPNDKR